MDELIISEIQLQPIRSKDGLVAFASCVVNNQFYIGSIAIYTSPSSPDGFRLVYASRLLSNGTKLPIVYPVNQKTGFTVQKVIVEEYLKLMEDLTKGSIPDDYEPTT